MELYRYEDIQYAPSLDEWDNPVGRGHTDVYLRSYKVIKETPKGFWIDMDMDGLALTERPNKKFVLARAKKKFACQTEEEAMESFLYRKMRQLDILKEKQRQVDSAIRRAESIVREKKYNVRDAGSISTRDSQESSERPQMLRM